MFLHQALPKGAQGNRKPKYQIRKRASPNHKDSARSINSQERPFDSSDKKTLHRISSKDKPEMPSVEKQDSLPTPKKISSLCLRKNNQQFQSPEQKTSSNFNLGSILRTRQNNENPSGRTNKMILCKMENRLFQKTQKEFQCTDLTAIEDRFWMGYEGQATSERVRQGFGTQFYSNGQRFVGIFVDDKAQGQGTYYGLHKRIMGRWQEGRLKQVFLQM